MPLKQLTRCVSRAACIQYGKGNHHTVEQAELTQQLQEKSTRNPDQIDLEDAIRKLEEEQEIRIAVQGSSLRQLPEEDEAIFTGIARFERLSWCYSRCMIDNFYCLYLLSI